MLVAWAAGGLGWPAAVMLACLVLAPWAGACFGRWAAPGGPLPLRRTPSVLELTTAAVFIGLLTLLPDAWLPLRAITVAICPNYRR